MTGQEVEPYELKTLLGRSYGDVMMDFRGPVKESFECAPVHARRTVDKLDESYEGALSEPWCLKYEQDGESALFSAEKIYDEVAEFADSTGVTVDPSHKVFFYPRENRGLEVEVRGMLDMGPEDIYRLLD